MLKATIIKAAYFAIRTYVGSGIFNRISEHVLELVEVDMPGDDKKKLVRESMRTEYAALKTIVIDTVIQIVLMNFLTPDVFDLNKLKTLD